MKNTFKLSILLILILTLAVAVLGCTKKTPDKRTTPGKQTEQKKPDKVETPEEKRDKETESLFDLTLRDDGNYEVKSYKGSQKEVSIPNEYKGKKVVGIGSNAFENSSIESITIPSTVEKIGDHAFYKCYALQAVTLNEGLKEIGWFTFAETAISEITIPSTIEGIVSDTFKNCKKLKSVTLNEGLESIGRGAFSGTSIEKITIPKSVDYIGTTFGDAKIKVVDGNSKYEVIDNCLIEKATKKIISGGKYSVIPDAVMEIGDEAFSGTSIESVTIPNTVEKIGRHAFYDCKDLKTVTFNEGLKELGDAAFSGTSIESITIPSTLEEIVAETFKGCKDLKTVTLKEGLKSIGRRVFEDTSIGTLTIPSTVNDIESSLGDVQINVVDGNAVYEAINNCLIEKSTRKLISGGKHSVIPDGIKEIGDSAFEGTAVETITTPSTLEKIERFAFAGCKNLKTVTLNEGLKTIGNGSFKDTSIEEIRIPSTVDDIHSSFGDAKIKVADGNAKYEAIDNCLIEKTTKKVISGGKHSILPEGIKEIGEQAFYGTSIEGITIPSTVEKIGRYAFHNCNNLKTVTLNEGLKSIGRGAFSGTSIESIEMTSTVEKIERFAFYDCKNLKTVTLNEGLKEIDSGAFRDCDKLGRIECNVKKNYVEANRSKFEGLIQKKSIINWLNG